jgi:hypothetical protein
VTQHDDLLYLAHIDEAATESNGQPPVVEERPSTRTKTCGTPLSIGSRPPPSPQRLSSAFKEQHAEIPWERAAGFRNRMVHGYLDIDRDIVWGIIGRDLPDLARCVRVELVGRRERDAPTRGRDAGMDIGF